MENENVPTPTPKDEDVPTPSPEGDMEIMKSIHEEQPKDAEVEELEKLSIKSMASMDFNEALDQLLDGKKIHKLEWNDLNYYGIMNKEILSLHKPDGKTYQWAISEADICGKDYVVIG